MHSLVILFVGLFVGFTLGALLMGLLKASDREEPYGPPHVPRYESSAALQPEVPRASDQRPFAADRSRPGGGSSQAEDWSHLSTWS